VTDSPGNPQTDAEHVRLVQDLQRRIDALHHSSEPEFGAFTRRDWILCVAGFLVFPYLLYLWYWP